MKISLADRRVLIALAVLLAAGAMLLMLIGTQPNAQPQQTPTPSPSATPTADLVASSGDLVFVDYTVRVENGSVYDTTLESVAREAGIYKSTIPYRPFNFTLGNGEVIEGFDEAVTGMRVGEQKTAVLPPEKAYGDYDPTYIEAVPRVYSISRIEAVPLTDFFSAYPGFSFTDSQTVQVDTWNATILAVTNDTVMLRHNPQVNQTIETGKWPSIVLNVTDTELILRHEPQLDKLYVTQSQDGEPRLATVRQIADDYFMLDYNAPLAGHTLNFTIKLLRIA